MAESGLIEDTTAIVVAIGILHIHGHRLFLASFLIAFLNTEERLQETDRPLMIVATDWNSEALEINHPRSLRRLVHSIRWSYWSQLLALLNLFGFRIWLQLNPF